MMATDAQNLTSTTWMSPNTSNSTHYTDGSLPLGDRKWFIIFKYSMYCIIFLISLIGNTMVCFVVCHRVKVKSVTNYFIMNLAISDLLYTLCVPLDIFTNKDFPYGSVMCRILWPAQTMTITASGFTLTALSVTRFWAVVYPLRRQLSTNQSGFVIVILWVLATSTVIPYIIFLQYISSTKKCTEMWPAETQRQTYTASLLVIQYAIPLMIITTCYIGIGFELTKGQTKTSNRTLAKARGKEARKVIKMLVLVTLTFAILTLPSTIMWMWYDFGTSAKHFAHFWDVLEVLNVFDFLNCASNPIIYSFCNESFSREFRRQLGCILPGPPSDTSVDSGKVTVLAAISSPGNGHATPLCLRPSLTNQDHSDCEQNQDTGTLL